MIKIKGIKRGRGSLESYIRSIYRANTLEINKAFQEIDKKLRESDMSINTASYETRFLQRVGNVKNIREIKARILDMNESKFILGTKERVAANNLFNDMRKDKDLWTKFRGLTRSINTGRFTSVNIDNLTFMDSGADENGTFAIYQYNNGDHNTYIKIYQSPNSLGDNITVTNDITEL